MKKFIIILFLLAAFPICSQGDENAPRQELIYFFSPSCDKCAHIREDVMPVIDKRFGNDISVVYKNTDEVENYKALFELKKKYSKDEKVVFPVLYMKGNFLDWRGIDGDDHAGKIIAFISSSIKGAQAAVVTDEKADPVKDFKKITLFAVLFAGLLDGVNPCSFTVMVFFISFLSMQRYNKKTIIASGCAFMLASFLTYLAIGLGLFGPLYAFKGYRAVTGTVTIIVGVLSIILGAVCLYDAIIFLKTKRPEDSILQLPESIKRRIHKVIGDEYRVDRGAIAAGHSGRNIFNLFCASLAIGFSISILESVCTGQLYIPTIIYVLKTTPYKLQALSYLLLYNLMFIVPLMGIFLFALAGITSQAFANVFKRYFLLIKVLMALLFFTLGVSIAFADEVKAAKDEKAVTADTAPSKPISSAPNPQRANDDTYWNFGKVKEGDIIKHKFIITNKIKEPLKITQVNTSCSCTTPKLEKDIMRPGEKISLEVEFNTAGYPGERTRYTYVHTDSDKVGIIVLEIRAEIVKKPDVKN